MIAIGAFVKGACAFFFDNPLGKLAGAFVLIGGMVGWFALDQRSRGAANVVVKVNSDANRKAAEARQVRARVPDSGNAEWLRKHSCRDC